MKNENSKQINTYSIKILTLGESTVGKTSIVTKLCDDTFTGQQMATTGIDSRQFTIKYNEDTVVHISLWDTAGQERFNNITKQYFNKVDGILLVYDITSRTSFNKIHNWINEINNVITPNELGIVLLGNKNDLELQREVQKDEGSVLGKELNMPFFETSAKTGKNLKESIALLSQIAIKKRKENDGSSSSRNSRPERTSQLTSNEKSKHKGCC